ncbi:MAG: hypothetical protein JSS07_01750 [Proteobacteria bacterium]|nr:hypothetical protein [Pseudomonadota bacterium]
MSKAPKLSMGEVFLLQTQSASLAIYDPDLLYDRLEENMDWFIESHYCELMEVQKGECGLIGLGAKGEYKICVKEAELTQEEKAFAKYTAYMGLKIISGLCYVGDEKQGRYFELPEGDYDLLIYGFDYAPLNALEPTLAAPLPDIVIIIQHRTSFFGAPLEEGEMFRETSKRYLFDSNFRKEIIAKYTSQKK